MVYIHELRTNICLNLRLSGVDDVCEYELKLSGQDREMDCKRGTRVLFAVSMLEDFAIRVESQYLLFLQLGLENSNI